jgi:hypothetical protein
MLAAISTCCPGTPQVFAHRQESSRRLVTAQVTVYCAIRNGAQGGALQRGRDATYGRASSDLWSLDNAGGVFGKDFRASDVIALGEFKQRSSKWLGRLIFIMVGLGLVCVGIKMLLRTE